MFHRKTIITVLVVFALGALAQNSLLRASPPIGAVVQDSHYDPAKQIVTFDLLNTSHKDISAYSMLVRVNHPDGTASTWEYGGDFLPFMVATGNGALKPGATFAIDVPLGSSKSKRHQQP